MLDLKFVRENADKVKEAIKNRNGKTEIDQLLNLDAQKRKLLTEVEQLLGLPTVDPVRTGVGRLVDNLIHI